MCIGSPNVCAPVKRRTRIGSFRGVRTGSRRRVIRRCQASRQAVVTCLARPSCECVEITLPCSSTVDLGRRTPNRITIIVRDTINRTLIRFVPTWRHGLFRGTVDSRRFASPIGYA